MSLAEVHSDSAERTTEVDIAIKMLCEWFEPYKNIVVLASGGIDSSLLACIVAKFKDVKTVTAITADSPSIPRAELLQVKEYIQRLGIVHRLVATEELENPEYRANRGDRCYFCKKALYHVVDNIISHDEQTVIVDGTNADDLTDHRPSLPASREHDIKHPFVELAIGKALIREMAKREEIPFWNKPSMACLASRVEEGVEVSGPVLQMIENAEEVLHNRGFHDIRVRYHESGTIHRLQRIARIELSAQDVARFIAEEHHTVIAPQLLNLGFDHVTLDLEGYKRGGRALKVIS